MTLRIEAVDSAEQWKQFAELPFAVYAGDSNWAPTHPDATIMRLSHRSPREQTKSWLATRDGNVVARVTAMTDELFDAQCGERTGFVGFFESLNDAAAEQELFACADRWFEERAVVRAFGPCSMNLFEVVGLLIAGADLRAVVGCAYTPTRYADSFSAAGWSPDRELLGYTLPITGADEVGERERRIGARLMERMNISLRPFAAGDSADRLESWFGNSDQNPWRHLELHWPLGAEDVGQLAALAQTPGTGIHVVEVMSNETTPIGVCAFHDDTNELMRELFSGVNHPTMTITERLARVETVRLVAYGFRPEFQQIGMSAAIPVLAEHMRSDYPQLRAIDFSWIDERNTPMVATAERFAGPPTRRWQLWSKVLQPRGTAHG